MQQYTVTLTDKLTNTHIHSGKRSYDTKNKVLPKSRHGPTH